MYLGCKDPNGDKWVFYITAKGWRWVRHALNGYKIGNSVRAYSSKYTCIKNAKRHGMLGTPV